MDKFNYPMAPREQQGEIGPLFKAWGTLMLQSFE
jgi:hypothetical protein